MLIAKKPTPSSTHQFLSLSPRLTLDTLLTSWPSAPAEKYPPAIRLPCPHFAAAAQCKSLALSLFLALG